MLLSPNLFNSVFTFPILNIIALYHYAFSLVQLPGTLGFSIIALTVTIRFLLLPFFKQQMETSKKMQDIKPHMDKLTQKHKGDTKKLQEEQMRLYQESGINPAAGCIFMLIQLPVTYALYQTLQLFFIADKVKVVQAINKVLYLPFLHFKTFDSLFFGVNLALTPKQVNTALIYLIPVITGFLQYLQTQSTMAMNPQSAPQAKQQNKKDGKKEDTSGDFQNAMNMQMKYVMPLMIGWFSLNMPIGLSLYWNVFSIFSIIQYKFYKQTVNMLPVPSKK